MAPSAPAFVCPLDLGALSPEFVCGTCRVGFPLIDVDGAQVRDLRAIEHSSQRSLSFSVPVPVLPSALREKVLVPRTWSKDLLSREELRKRYGSKLSAGFQHHLKQIVAERGTNLVALDLGCGKGGNKRYLADLGITQVSLIDWWNAKAEVLADAHRLPFPDQSFDLVISTAVLEHCYLPYLVMREVQRVLRPRGSALMGASFWESWHGESFFHFTPNGVYAICHQAELDLVDVWSGWGFIPAILTHAVSKRLKRPGYLMQRVWDGVSARIRGEEKSAEKNLRTSGAMHFRADRVR
jgi:SAM-dependent methyltransferase